MLKECASVEARTLASGESFIEDTTMAATPYNPRCVCSSAVTFIEMTKKSSGPVCTGTVVLASSSSTRAST